MTGHEEEQRIPSEKEGLRAQAVPLGRPSCLRSNDDEGVHGNYEQRCNESYGIELVCPRPAS